MPSEPNPQRNRKKKWIFSIFLGSYRFLSLLGYDHSLKVPSQGCVTKTNVNRPLYAQPFCTRVLCLLWSFKAMANLHAKGWWQLCKTLSKVVRSAGTERLGAPGHAGNACIVESPSYILIIGPTNQFFVCHKPPVEGQHLEVSCFPEFAMPGSPRPHLPRQIQCRIPAPSEVGMHTVLQ